MYTMEGYLDDPSSGPPAGPPRGTDRCGEPRDAATHVRPTRQHAARNGAQARIDTRKQGPRRRKYQTQRATAFQRERNEQRSAHARANATSCACVLTTCVCKRIPHVHASSGCLADTRAGGRAGLEQRIIHANVSIIAMQPMHMSFRAGRVGGARKFPRSPAWSATKALNRPQ